MAPAAKNHDARLQISRKSTKKEAETLTLRSQRSSLREIRHTCLARSGCCRWPTAGLNFPPRQPLFFPVRWGNRLWHQFCSFKDDGSLASGIRSHLRMLRGLRDGWVVFRPFVIFRILPDNPESFLALSLPGWF